MSDRQELSQDALARLAEVIEQRRQASPDSSYVARLFARGIDAMLKKVGEEATEVVMAAKDGEPSKIVAETADLWFHTMLVLAAFNLKPADVIAELQRREGLSGLEEFAAREMEPPSSLALGSPQGGRPPNARRSRFRGGKVDV